MKNGRQPYVAIRFPPKKMPNAGPNASPACVIALTKPRRLSGTFSTKILLIVGKETDSPTPRSSRHAKSAAKLPASPLRIVANDHMRKPTTSTRLAEERSMSHPMNGCAGIYEMKKAVSKNPRRDGER